MMWSLNMFFTQYLKQLIMLKKYYSSFMLQFFVDLNPFIEVILKSWLKFEQVFGLLS